MSELIFFFQQTEFCLLIAKGSMVIFLRVMHSDSQGLLQNN